MEVEVEAEVGAEVEDEVKVVVEAEMEVEAEVEVVVEEQVWKNIDEKGCGADEEEVRYLTSLKTSWFKLIT